jgi:tetratricopeptide (TPR) repeat protein
MVLKKVLRNEELSITHVKYFNISGHASKTCQFYPVTWFQNKYHIIQNVEKYKNNLEKMTSRYKSFSYEITTSPEFMNDKFGIAPELFRQFETLHHKAQKGGSKIIERLILLIEKYPGVPQIKNYLSVAYMNSDNIEKAREVNHWIIKEHPDYLFGKLNLAFEYYSKKQFDKIPEVVGSLMEIQDLYPDRDCFHLSEVTSFNKLAIMYFCAMGNLKAAESRYEIIEELASEHPDTKEVFPYLMKARLETAQKRMEEENRTRISVKTIRNNQAIQRETKPEFRHKEINWLYENGLRIDGDKLKIILNLPYDSLVSDLTLILKDTIFRYNHFKKLANKSGEWLENRLSFPVHAVYLLGELKAEESLNDILETFRQEEEFIEFWYGDFMTGNLWEPLYYIADNQLGALKEFVLSPNIWTYARSEVSGCVGQIGLHQPDKKKEVTEWFREVFNYLAKSSLDEEIIDSDFIGLAICDALELRAPDLLPGIKKLFDLGYVGTGICGSYDEVEQDMYEPPRDYYKKELLNIYDRYNQIITTWAGYTDEEDYSGNRKDGSFQADPKIGRNDPCPCGSGKKYKKCCLRN